MLVFLDCEYTDPIDIELISIGMVSEDGKFEFYAERNDFPADQCNDFVRAAVLPILAKSPEVACNRDQLAIRLKDWFAMLPRQVRIACDSRTDIDLLIDALDENRPDNLINETFDLRPLIDTTAYNSAVCRYHDQPGQPWHHALHDARAHRLGWLAWSDKNKLR